MDQKQSLWLFCFVFICSTASNYIRESALIGYNKITIFIGAIAWSLGAIMVPVIIILLYALFQLATKGELSKNLIKNGALITSICLALAIASSMYFPHSQ